LGIARTTRAAAGNAARKVASSTPARIETRIVSGPISRSAAGAASPLSFCGFMPRSRMPAVSPSGGAVNTRTPGAAGAPLGRITVIAAGSRPASSHPLEHRPGHVAAAEEVEGLAEREVRHGFPDSAGCARRTFGIPRPLRF
jgi:hypothetical protein